MLGNLYSEKYEKAMESEFVGGGTVLVWMLREALKEENKYKEMVKKYGNMYH